jgi:hypothetical protein
MSTSVPVLSYSLVGNTKLTGCRGAVKSSTGCKVKHAKGFKSHYTFRTGATKTLDVKRRVLGEEHPDTLITIADVADLWQDQGKYGQAEGLYARVLTVRRRVLGTQHPDTIAALASLGGLQLRQRHFDEAEPFIRQALFG